VSPNFCKEAKTQDRTVNLETRDVIRMNGNSEMRSGDLEKRDAKQSPGASKRCFILAQCHNSETQL